MRIWLRLLIVWCVAIALPVQGMAGVTMAQCGPSHARMGAALASASHAHAHGDDGMTHVHGVAASTVSHAADGSLPAHDATPSDAAPDLAQYKCSSCASCCAGFALPSAAPRVPQPTAAPAVFVDAEVAVDPFASDGPRRPPRHPLV